MKRYINAKVKYVGNDAFLTIEFVFKVFKRTYTLLKTNKVSVETIDKYIERFIQEYELSRK